MTKPMLYTAVSIYATVVSVWAASALADDPAWYVKKETWHSTLRASVDEVRHAGDIDATEGLVLAPWHVVGPWRSPEAKSMDAIFKVPFPPETAEFNTQVAFDGGKLKWVAHGEWEDGKIHRLTKDEEFCAFYLTRTITAPDLRVVVARLGSDDAVALWLNGVKVHANNVGRLCAPDQETVALHLKKGENRLVMKIVNGVLMSEFYFRVQRLGRAEATKSVMGSLGSLLARDFPDPDATRKIAWLMEDDVFGDSPRFFRYDDPQVAFSGRWQYTVTGAPDGCARRCDRAGEQASLAFVGTDLEVVCKRGRLEQMSLLTRDAEKLYGVAGVSIDGADTMKEGDNGGPGVITGLQPGMHRSIFRNLGRPTHPGGSTAVALMGFRVHAKAANETARLAWRYALWVRGGACWQKRAVELAGQAVDEAGLEAVAQLYFASREVDAASAKLRAFHAAPPSSPMVDRERKLWTPTAETAAYLARLEAIRAQAETSLSAADALRFDPAVPAEFTAILAELKRVGREIDECLAAEARKLPPIVFFTGSPLASGAVPNYVWQSNPHDGRWGASIRIWDPSQPEKPARVVFEDPHAILFDLNRSCDAKTLFFSMRRGGQQYWQIYEIGADGKNLKQITEGNHYNVCPTPLPDGRLAFLSNRSGGSHTVCQSGPSMHVYVMNRDGTGARDLSANTLTDFGLSSLADGRLIFTRWEYVDADLSYRQSLWTEYPDGRQLALHFGNTIADPAAFWQAREIPGRGAVVCTLAPHHGSPYGALAIVSRLLGIEGARDEGFRWITEDFPVVEDLNPFWAYRDPCPVSQNQLLASCGAEGLGRFRIILLDEMANKTLVYDDPNTSCFYPQPLRAQLPPEQVADLTPERIDHVDVPAAEPAQPQAERVALGRFLVSDVYQGLGGDVAQGRIKSIRIMEQVPKTVNTTWHRVYDQGPLMSGGATYYAKRCWGYAPVEADGSAWFEAPAGKELYFQICDAQGRELRRMTSGSQLMPGETQGCIGCHENRDLAPPGNCLPLAARREPTPLRLPEWASAGVIDYAKVIQPILDRHCTSCHSGQAPAGRVALTGGSTRFFNMSYDNLVVRSQSAQVSTDLYLGLNTDLPLVQFNNMFPGIYSPHKALTTGSLASRLPDYFKPSHCRSEVSAAEMRRLYEWIDAMAPYYTTYHSARPGSYGDRDKWGDNVEAEKMADWYTKGFLPVYTRRCESCHGQIHLGQRYEWGGKWAWIDLQRPEWSPALSAHLSKEAGGQGITEKDFGGLLTSRWRQRRSSMIDRWGSLQEDHRVMEEALAAGRKVQPFADASDPDYQAMLTAIRQGRDSLQALPEADMPGFVSRTQDRAFGYRGDKN